MATSPFVSPPLAGAGGAVSRLLAPMAPAPTAAPFSRNERRSVRRQDCSTFSMVFSFGSSGERRAGVARGSDGLNDAARGGRHNSAGIPRDTAPRSGGGGGVYPRGTPFFPWPAGGGSGG